MEPCGLFIIKRVLSLAALIGGILLLAFGNNDDGELRNDSKVEHYGYAMTQLLGCGLVYPFVYHFLFESHDAEGNSNGGGGLFDFLYGLCGLAVLGGWMWSWDVLDASGDYLEDRYPNVWAALVFVNVVLALSVSIVLALWCAKTPVSEIADAWGQVISV